MAKKEQKVKKSAKTEKAVKAKAKSKEVESKKKGDKEVKGKTLSPLEKARLAKAKGGKGDKKGKGKPKKNALPTFDAPEDFKPAFFTVKLKVEKDGLLGNAIQMTRYQGRYDPEADDKKKFDVATYDQKTVQGVLARFAGVTFITNATKRIPAGVYEILLRVNRKSADGSLSVLFKGMGQLVRGKKAGVVKVEPLDKTDPVYRRFRKAARILPAAFKDVQMPPKRTRGANKAKDEGDDE